MTRTSYRHCRAGSFPSALPGCCSTRRSFFRRSRSWSISRTRFVPRSGRCAGKSSSPCSGLRVLFGVQVFAYSQVLLYSALQTSLLPFNSVVLLIACAFIVVSLVWRRLGSFDVYPSQAFLYRLAHPSGGRSLSSRRLRTGRAHRSRGRPTEGSGRRFRGSHRHTRSRPPPPLDGASAEGQGIPEPSFEAPDARLPPHLGRVHEANQPSRRDRPSRRPRSETSPRRRSAAPRRRSGW